MVAGHENDRLSEREEMLRTQIEHRGVRSAPVLDAMRRVPREWFLPANLAGRAYVDSALPIDCHQTISQPYMVARMTELLELTPDSRVLEVGTGSGYQTAVLACLAREVFTIEWHSKLMALASERLRRLGMGNVRFSCGDGSVGWPKCAPFDAILVTAGAPAVPDPLCEQLGPDGQLVVPIGPMETQTLVRVRNTPSGPQRENILSCRFVKLLGAAGWRA